jgi:phosphonatase-like hydrolase
LKQFAALASIPAAASARAVPRPKIRLVVLDIGGTIIEDRGDIPQALRDALAHHGVASNAEEINRRRGASKRQVIRYFVDRQNPPAAVDREKLTTGIHEEFTANIISIYRSVPPIAGAEATIRQLRDRGYLVATTTGFDKVIAESIFGRLGWQQFFAATICADDVTEGRPAPYMLFHAMEAAAVSNVAEVVAVGDTPLDLQAGTNAGVRGVVGVYSGAASAERLRSEPHTHILRSVAGLPALLERF